MKITKATRKFNKNHLKSEMERRKNKRRKNVIGGSGKKDIPSRKPKSPSDEQQPQQSDESNPENEMSEHRETLEKLKEQDPEFYEFLKENDKDLLEFGEEELPNDLASEDGDSVNQDLSEQEDGDDENGDDDEQVGDDEQEKFIAEGSPVLNEQQIEVLHNQLVNERSLKAVHAVIKTLRAVMDSNANNDEEEMIIHDEIVLSNLVKLVVRDVPQCLCFHGKIPTQRDRPIKLTLPSSSKGSSVRSACKSYVIAIKTLLQQTTDPEMQEFLLHELDASNAAPLLAIVGLNRNVKDVLKNLIIIATTVNNGRDDSEDVEGIESERSLRIGALILIKQWVMHGEDEFRNYALKQLYKSFLATSKATTPYTIAAIRFLCESMTEIFSLFPKVAYQHAFTAIRAIAISLRNALVHPSQDHAQALLNWSNIHAIRFWVLFLNGAALKQPTNGDDWEKSSKGLLAQLYYPLIQVSMGICRVAPIKTHAPLHLHILESLLPLSGPSSMHLPVAAGLIGVLKSLVITLQSNGPRNEGSSKLSGGKPINLATTLKLSSSYEASPINYMPMIEKAMECIEKDFVAWSYFVGFPEWTFMLVMNLKRVKKLLLDGNNVKTSPNKKNKKQAFRTTDGVKKRIQGLLDAVDENSEWIRKQRASGTDGPVDLLRKKSFEVPSKSDQTSPLQKYLDALKRVKNMAK